MPQTLTPMGDWQDLAQTVVIALLFAYFLAKLISTVVHFKDENLSLARETTPEPTGEEVKEGPLVESGSDDDWEGVESTELDEEFSAATAFVAATAADRGGKVGSDVQLELYGLYKIATEGACTVPQPSALKMTARAKWNAWQRLGAMPPEEAMERYIEIVNEHFPTWSSGSAAAKNKGEGSQGASSETKGPMGPVFSSLIHEEGSDNELKLDDIHVSAREGDADNLLTHLDNDISVNMKDSEGRTPLHWAIDRGHIHVVEMLLSRKADVNDRDNEGQTPLHYAALCDRKDIAEMLVKHGASLDIKDNDGNSPSDLGGSSWSFMKSSN